MRDTATSFVHKFEARGDIRENILRIQTAENSVAQEKENKSTKTLQNVSAELLRFEQRLANLVQLVKQGKDLLEVESVNTLESRLSESLISITGSLLYYKFSKIKTDN